MGLLLYPYFLVVFWYRDFFLGSVRTTINIWVYLLDLLSVPILLKTFFKPIKNEYRDGLVFFSVIMGMVVKSVILIISAVFLIAVFIVFVIINILILVLPFLIARFLI